MTKQESFKRRVRARMEHTGERYSAARRVILEKTSNQGRTWISLPEVNDDSVRDHTGRGWDEWCDLIDSGPGRSAGHTAIAAWVQDEHRVGAWWAQAVTIGYERITGLRLPGQMADGTFTATRSRTMKLDADAVREMLLSETDRQDLFPEHDTVLRSRESAKRVRIAMGGGVAEFSIDPRDDGKVKITVAHVSLPDVESMEHWKFYWREWLDALTE